jgi:hypothetical protein
LAAKLTAVPPLAGADVKLDGAIALSLNVVPVLSADTEPCVPPAFVELSDVKSVLAAMTPGVPTVSTHVAVTIPVKGTLAVAAAAECAESARAATAKKFV